MVLSLLQQVLTTTQSKKTRETAISIIGNLLSEVENPDLGQRVIKETQILQFLSNLTQNYDSDLAKDLPWLINNLIYHCYFQSESYLEEDDSVNICMRLLSVIL